MAEIRIVADNAGGGSSSGSSTPPPFSGQSGAASGGTAADNTRTAGGYVPDNNRLTEEYRKLIQQQGGTFIPGSANANLLFKQFESSQRELVTQRVESRYDERHDALYAEYSQKRKAINERYDKELEDFKKQHPGEIEASEYERRFIAPGRNKELSALDKEEEQRHGELEAQKEGDLTSALEALTNILKDIKEGSERESESGAPQSYLGRLKTRRTQLIKEREEASTEEEAIAATKRIAEIDDKMGRVFNTRRPGAVAGVFDSIGSITSGMSNVMTSLARGDLAGGTMGMGSTVAGALGSAGAMSAAAITAGITAAVASGLKIANIVSDNYNAASMLASFRGTVTEGYTGQSAVNEILYSLNKSVFTDIVGREIKFTDLGIDSDTFAKRAEQNVRTRGTGSDWYAETIRQIGLEKQFGLQSGALAQGAQFDRYGQTVTQSIMTLVEALNRRGVEGANTNDFSRVQEKFDFQQAIMQGYRSRNDRPNFDAANRAVIAMNTVSGITHDSRDVTDYQTIQNAIQNPMNDRMQALVYSTVQEIMPQLVDFRGKNFSATDAGRLDLIDQAIKNSENESKIMQAVIKRIEQMFGGLDTQMGYFAFTNVFRGISVDRLSKIMTDFANEGSEAGRVLRGEEKTLNERDARALTDAAVIDAAGYTSEMSKDMKKISQMLSDFFNQMATRGYSAVEGSMKRAVSGQ